MSSSPTRIRSSRIKRIVAWAEEQELAIDQSGAYDTLLRRSNELWPELRFKTRESYAKAAYRILLIADGRRISKEART